MTGGLVGSLGENAQPSIGYGYGDGYGDGYGNGYGNGYGVWENCPALAQDHTPITE